MFDLGAFSVGDMVACSSQLRQVAEGAASMEEAARSIVHYLRAHFVDPRSRTPSFTLARLFQTVPWDRLTPTLREYVQLHSPIPHATAELRCLTLLGSEGDLPAWCDRTTSRHHQAVPLPSRDAVVREPILGAVLAALNIDADAAIRGAAEDGEAVRDADLFYVRDAGTSAAAAQVREFVTTHRIASILGFGGALPSGDVFTCVLFSHTPIPAVTVENFRTVAAAARLALLPFHQAPLFSGESAPFGAAEQAEAARLTALEALLRSTEDTSREQAEAARTAHGILERSEEELRAKQRRLEQEARIIQTLYSVGQQLGGELNLDRLIQAATDAATQVIVAEFGAFFFTDAAAADEAAAAHPAFAVSGLDRAGDAGWDGGRALFADDFARTEPLRSDDITTDDRLAARALLTARIPGLLPARSYLAVPVRGPDGAALGSFHFVHHMPGIFTARDEQLARGVAAQTGAALGNALLYAKQRETAIRLQRSLLPDSPPQLDELEVAFRYLPGGSGNQVGGDWFDVIPLAAGRVALVIGDVMGHGITAAAVMGQLRTAVRAYAVMDLPPAQLMHNLNRLVAGMGVERFATCVYAVYDPVSATVCWANAGHLPPAVITEDGHVTLLEDTDGTPLGIDGAIFDESTRPLPPATRLLLYTDGLVESHARPLSERLKTLRAELAGLEGHPEAACDALLKAMLSDPDNPDDVALLLVRTRATLVRTAELALPPSISAAREARRFVHDTLAGWGLDDQRDQVASVVSEMVINACQHARTALQVRLRRHPRRTIMEVADGDGRLPRPTAADPLDERHRGLLIVTRLTSRWGVRPTETGKVVWAEITDTR